MSARSIVLGAVALLALGLAACGDDDEPTAASPTTTAAKAQKITDYENEIDAREARAIFGREAGDGTPSKDLAGRWVMKLNETLGLLDLGAPDLGGPSLKIESMDGDRMVLSDRFCPDVEMTFEVIRTAQSIEFRHVRGKCTETQDIVAAGPWTVYETP